MVSLFVIIALLFAGVAATVRLSTGQWTPKLGLDLEGGTQMILEPVLPDGATVSEGQVTEARNIIAQRVDSYGVAEAEVTTQGGQNIVISIPGTPDPRQLEAIRKPSQLRFRAVLVAQQVVPTPTATGTVSGTATPGATSTPEGPVFTPAPGNTLTPAGGTLPRGLRAETDTPTSTDSPTSGGAASPTPTDASDPAWVTEELATQFEEIDCSSPDATTELVDDPDKPLVACSQDGFEKFILGPVELDGTGISDAVAGYQTGPNGQPTTTVEVALSFNAEGAQTFGEVTTRLVNLEGDRNRFAILLDKVVISAPSTNAAITNGQASITGGFTIESARDLARQLKFGALPLSFTLLTQDDISPQLGVEQLRLGLLAGLIGLILVVIYSLFQYRALGLVTVASLFVAAAMTYALLVLFGYAYNFRLTMAGITGVIVSIGVTADSFIVYFERIRDEVREGRPLVAAVEAGWIRARRTIIAADVVNLLAAGVLYLLATANVRGFAFTLGVLTVVDLVVVMLFTHPLVAMLSHTRFFGGGHKWSGLDPERLGSTAVRYVGRGRFVDDRPKQEPLPGSDAIAQGGAPA